MRILVVVQRYGPDIAGGAEQLARALSIRLVGRGHEVEVLTSCAKSYQDWANAYPAGTSEDDGVLVHRLTVDHRRRNDVFGPLDSRVRGAGTLVPLAPVVSDAWNRMLGPELGELPRWLDQHVGRFDLVAFSGYMFPTTTIGLPHVAGAVPTLVQPVVHDEPYLRLPAVRPIFEHAAGICALTEEEAELIRRRFRPPGVLEVVGGAVERPIEVSSADVTRERLGLGDRPYLVCVGRVEEGKGTPELVDYFDEYVSRHGTDLQLVLVGRNVANVKRKRNVVLADYVDEELKWSLLAHAELLVQPSYFESFSLSLVEGWLQGRAALVQGRCDVLAGQVRRARGGLTYSNYAEFDAALDVLLSSPALRADLGRSGREYARRYEWPTVLDAFEGLCERAMSRWVETDGGPLRSMSRGRMV